MTAALAPLPAPDALAPAIPVLEGARVRLRAPAARDLPAYAAFCASPRTAPLGGPFDADAAFARLSALIGHWALRGFGRWMVADRESDAPLGVVGLMQPPSWPGPELAWTLFEHAEGRGLAHESARLARDFAGKVAGISDLVSLIAPENHRSAALARRLGAVPDGETTPPGKPTLTVWRHPSPGKVTDYEAAR